MVRQAYTFLRMPFSEKRFVLHAVFILTKYRIFLKTKSFQQLFKLAMAEQQQCFRSAPLPFSLERTVILIAAAAKYTPSSTCLSHALGAMALFASQSHFTDLHIGVKKPSDVFAAHAWLTVDDMVVAGWVPDLQHYTELPPAEFNRDR